MNKILLSPPFSNIKLLSSYKNTSRITGTYTLHPRPGLHRVLTTLRKIEGGWINNVGLRNPGIFKANSEIVSIAEINEADFELMLYILDKNPNVHSVEFNISCPNVDITGIRSDVLYVANQCFDNVIVKLPHNISDYEVCSLLEKGDFIPHVSNTKPSPKGSISGISLVERNISTIQLIKKERPDIKVIAGGGIYNMDIAKHYYNSGADMLSLSTILINPFKTWRLINELFEYHKTAKDK